MELDESQITIADHRLWHGCTATEKSHILWDLMQHAILRAQDPIKVEVAVRPSKEPLSEKAERFYDRLCVIDRPQWQYFADLYSNEMQTDSPRVIDSTAAVASQQPPPSKAKLSVPDLFLLVASVVTRESGDVLLTSTVRKRFSELTGRPLRNPAIYVRDLETRNQPLLKVVTPSSGQTPHSFKLTEAGLAQAKDLERDHPLTAASPGSS